MHSKVNRGKQLPSARSHKPCDLRRLTVSAFSSSRLWTPAPAGLDGSSYSYDGFKLRKLASDVATRLYAHWFSAPDLLLNGLRKKDQSIARYLRDVATFVLECEDPGLAHQNMGCAGQAMNLRSLAIWNSSYVPRNSPWSSERRSKNRMLLPMKPRKHSNGQNLP